MFQKVGLVGVFRELERPVWTPWGEGDRWPGLDRAVSAGIGKAPALSGTYCRSPWWT